MFEGKPPIAPQSRNSGPGENRADELRALSWSDLTARLAAARDLRAELAQPQIDPNASFDADSARRLASLTDRPPGHGKQGVNPLALANGKGARCNGVDDTQTSDQADRGN